MKDAPNKTATQRTPHSNQNGLSKEPVLGRTLLTLQTVEELPKPFECVLSQLLSPQRQACVLSHLPKVGGGVPED
jgi:hypothetical protein